MHKKKANPRVSDRVARAMRKLLKAELDKGRGLEDISISCGMSHSWAWHMLKRKPTTIENPLTSTATKVLHKFGLTENLLPRSWGGKQVKKGLVSLQVIQPKVRVASVRKKVGSTKSRAVIARKAA